MTDKENGVSPVIGVMLMIVVTIVIAAVVSAIAGDIGSEKKAGPSVSLDAQTKYSLGSSAPCPVTTLTITYTKPDGTTYTRQKTTCKGSMLGVNRDGLVFTHEGGDPIDLKDLQLKISSGDIDYTLDYYNVKNGVPVLGLCNSGSPKGDCGANGYISDLSVYSATDTRWNGYTADQIMAEFPSRYFYKLGPDGLIADDTIIRPGDSFIWLVDNNFFASGKTGDAAAASRASYWVISTYDKNGNYASFAIERGINDRWELSHKPSGESLARGVIEWPNT